IADEFFRRGDRFIDGLQLLGVEFHNCASARITSIEWGWAGSFWVNITGINRNQIWRNKIKNQSVVVMPRAAEIRNHQGA
ncbi:MAG: hypothetical protein PVG19_01235, partial [Desulfobacterales bacterium]